MASAQQEFNAWEQMMAMQGQNVVPQSAAQLFEQSTQFPLGGMPPDEMLPSPMMAPPPPPPPEPVVQPPVRRTAQPTTQALGDVAQEIAPEQLGPGPVRRLSLREEIELAHQNYGQGLTMQQAEVDKLKEGLAKYTQEERGIDFTPLAAALDSWYGGNLTAAAKSVAPESASQKSKNILDMQSKLVEAQKGVSASELAGLQQRLSQMGYEEQRNTQKEVARINAAARSSGEYLDQREEARREKQTIDYSSHVGKQAQSLSENIANLEQGLGFRLSSIDPKTGKVSGRAVDIPGFSLPIVGRVNVTEEAADINARFAPIFNTVLRDRSGAAVTSHELDRLKNEFSQGKFNSEDKLLAAVRRFKDAAVKTLKAQEAGYVKEVRARYQGQGGQTVDDLFGRETQGDDEGDDLGANLDAMTPEQLKAWLKKHGGGG